MEKYKKVIVLFLALLFPVCIFLFLKLFGKNEFAVPPLYSDVYPDNLEACGVTVELPYRIPDSVRNWLSLPKERLTLIYFGSGEEKNLDNVTRENRSKLEFKQLSDTLQRLKNCIFFLEDPKDLTLVEGDGTIRGQYDTGDRDEIDRLRMELSILFKEY
jgi:hypothetical protein